MEKYEVVFAETAISDLEELVYYISDELQNPAAALRSVPQLKLLFMRWRNFQNGIA